MSPATQPTENETVLSAHNHEQGFKEVKVVSKKREAAFSKFRVEIMATTTLQQSYAQAGQSKGS